MLKSRLFQVLVWPIAFAVISVPLTYGGWFAYGLFVNGWLFNIPFWIWRIVIYVTLWPTALFDYLGLNRFGNDTVKFFLPGMICWGAVGGAIGLLWHVWKSRKNKATREASFASSEV